MCQMWLLGTSVCVCVWVLLNEGIWSSSHGVGWSECLTSMEKALHQPPSSCQARPMTTHLEAELATAGGRDYCRDSELSPGVSTEAQDSLADFRAHQLE